MCPWCLQFPDKERLKSTRVLNLSPLCAYLSASGLEEYTCINVDNMQPNRLQRATDSQEGNIVSNPYTTGTESPSTLPDSHEYVILLFMSFESGRIYITSKVESHNEDIMNILFLILLFQYVGWEW